MRKIEKELRECKQVAEVQLLDLNQSPEVTHTDRIRRLLAAVSLYRIIYKVGKLSVVGYVAVPKTGRELPGILHLRGGGGDFAKLTHKSLIGHLVRYACEGYVVVAPQYPGVDGVEGSDHYGDAEDMKSITVLQDILQSLSAVDGSRVGVKGHSRGGLMAYMLLRQGKRIKAAVIGGAPTDQVRQGEERRGWRAHQIKHWGTSQQETIKRSPLRWVDELPKKTPILLMHGSADWRVNPLDSIEMSRLLYEKKIPHRFILFEGADHVMAEYREEYVRQTMEWFERFLKHDEKLPNLEPHGA